MYICSLLAIIKLFHFFCMLHNFFLSLFLDIKECLCQQFLSLHWGYVQELRFFAHEFAPKLNYFTKKHAFLMYNNYLARHSNDESVGINWQYIHVFHTIFPLESVRCLFNFEVWGVVLIGGWHLEEGCTYFKLRGNLKRL